VIREAFEAGAAEFFVKPVTPLLLRRVVLKQLGREAEIGSLPPTVRR